MLGAIGIQPFSLVGQIVSFLILYFVFRKFLFGPILEGLDKRANKQKQALKAAEKTIKIKEEIEAHAEKARVKLQQEIRQEMQKMRDETAVKKEELVSAAQEEAHRAAEKEYEIFAQKMSQNEQKIKKDISGLVIKVARKTLTEHLDQKTGKEIVKKQIEKLAKLKL